MSMHAPRLSGCDGVPKLSKGKSPISRGPTSAILFVDESDWDCFFQLSADLRRAGFATIRLTTARPCRSVTAFNSIFSHTLWIQTPEDLEFAACTASRYQVVDIQCTETSAELAYRFADRLNGLQRPRTWEGRSVIVDKLAASTLLAVAGLDTPETLDAATIKPTEAVERLGLPLVLKHRIGSSGAGVRIVATLDDLTELSMQWAGDATFYERYVPGPQFAYGALCAVGDIRLAATYRVHERAQPLAAPSLIEYVNVPEIDDIGRSVARIARISGLLNLNLICDETGKYWINDVNPRAWGSMQSARSIGIDFSAGYINWLRGVEPPELDVPTLRHCAQPGLVRIFPAALARHEGEPGIKRDFARWVWARRNTSGIRYVCVELIRSRRQLLPPGLVIFLRGLKRRSRAVMRR